MRRSGRRLARLTGLLLALAALGGCAARWPFVGEHPSAGLLRVADDLASRGEFETARAKYDELATKYPDAPAAPRARAVRDALAKILETREQIERLRGELAAREAELARLRQSLSTRETELARARQELQRIGTEADRLRADLEELKRIDLRLERRR